MAIYSSEAFNPIRMGVIQVHPLFQVSSQSNNNLVIFLVFSELEIPSFSAEKLHRTLQKVLSPHHLTIGKLSIVSSDSKPEQCSVLQAKGTEYNTVLNQLMKHLLIIQKRKLKISDIFLLVLLLLLLCTSVYFFFVSDF